MLEQRIESYFDTLHCNLWSRAYEVFEDAKSRPEAVEFVVKLVKDLGLVSLVKEREISDDPLNGYASNDYT